MPYQIQNVENGSFVVRDHNPAQFPDGAQAAAFLKALKDKGDKRQLKILPVNDPIADRAWQERERVRMRTEYVDVPFVNVLGPEYWWRAAVAEVELSVLKRANSDHYSNAITCHGRAQYHFAHVSLADKTKLAYTPDSRHGVEDRQLSISPGGYLKKYFSDILSHDQITALVMDWQLCYDSAELKFARTAEEIVRIYQTGPRSCMSGSVDEYHSRKASVHPCEVYGLPHSDITMAYIANNKGVSARVLVWEAEKKHSRIYGDATLLMRELKALGYVASPMYGAKIAKIKAGKAYVMPYLDDTRIVIDEGNHFKLFNGEQRLPEGKAWLNCRHTNGLSNNSDLTECSDCGEEVDENDTFSLRDQNVCRSCIEDHYFLCDATGEYCNENSRHEVRVSPNSHFEYGWRTETWGERAVERCGFWCGATNAYYHQTYRRETEDGTEFSTQAVADGIYVACDGIYYHKDDLPKPPEQTKELTEQLNTVKG